MNNDQSDCLDGQLAAANARIAELERHNKVLLIEIDRCLNRLIEIDRRLNKLNEMDRRLNRLIDRRIKSCCCWSWFSAEDPAVKVDNASGVRETDVSRDAFGGAQ